MRTALDRMLKLYKASPIFQDLVETAAGTALVAAGQASMSEMSPQEIALASLGTMTAGMVGRPIAGRIGQMGGKVLDKSFPETSQLYAKANQMGPEQPYPEALKSIVRAKYAPYSHLGGFAQHGNVFGRQYGDNLAQLGVGLAAPVIFATTDDDGEVVPLT